MFLQYKALAQGKNTLLKLGNIFLALNVFELLYLELVYSCNIKNVEKFKRYKYFNKAV